MHPFFRIKRALPATREMALKGGDLHPLWDIITDAEHVLEGNQSLAYEADPEMIADTLERIISTPPQQSQQHPLKQSRR